MFSLEAPARISLNGSASKAVCMVCVCLIDQLHVRHVAELLLKLIWLLTFLAACVAKHDEH